MGSSLLSTLSDCYDCHIGGKLTSVSALSDDKLAVVIDLLHGVVDVRAEELNSVVRVGHRRMNYGSRQRSLRHKVPHMQFK
eukprot:3805876-Pleurochrysis_carterae.AAC.1